MVKINNITNGKYKLIFGERLLLIDEGPLDIELELDGTFNVDLNFNFVKKENEKSKLSYKSQDIDSGVKIIFELVNFDSPLGTGLIDPISILNHNIDGVDKSVVLTCFVYKHNKAHHILDVAIYEEK